MARKTSIELDWADGTYLFHLDIPRLKELQERCDAGPPEVLKRLVEGRARVEDAQETVRLGLIGGGLPAPQAAKLVRLYAGDETPLAGGHRGRHPGPRGRRPRQCRRGGHPPGKPGSGDLVAVDDGRIDFAALRANALIIGLHSLDGLSLEEFNEIVAAWNRAQDPQGDPELTEGEENALAAWIGLR